MLFKTKVSLKDFCRRKFDLILSDTFHTTSDEFRNRCGPDFSDRVDPDQYLAHFRAAYLELLGVAFSRTLKRDQRYDVMFMEQEYLKKNGCVELDDLHQLYNSAFGSSPADGVKQMAVCLADHIHVQGADTATVIHAHHEGFYRILKDLPIEIKKIKLV